MVELADDVHPPRPCVVISDETRHKRDRFMMVVPFQTGAQEGPTRIILSGKELQDAGVKNGSVLMCDMLTTVPHEYITDERRKGFVHPHTLAEIIIGVRLALLDHTAVPMS
jgi:mRNA-degrading endonuclease toxin of MazEF toxin-antitoxin module